MSSVRIKGVEYPATNIRRVPLADILAMQAELKKVGGVNGVTTWAQIVALADAYAQMQPVEVLAHEDYPFFMGIVAWATLRGAGQKIGFLDLLADLSIDDMQDVPDVAPAEGAPGKG